MQPTGTKCAPVGVGMMSMPPSNSINEGGQFKGLESLRDSAAQAGNRREL